ncbi:probable histone-lysine N-methyltransferase set-23 [Anastrepha ludens]|uniref:probable histone-lysine N-methyltransferase set-23 n=1 Tax=Anastrepha ludens TaxID=28586 RepID=UPI0023B0BF4B|nr:probable histone-lysine N-methyltransferase set-23 [Anastrepha ludens]
MEIELNAFDICDDYEHIDPSLCYVLENVLSTQVDADHCEEYQKLKQSFNSILLNGCECIQDPHNCSVCSHGGNYKWNAQFRELVLDSERSKELIYECSSVCRCDPYKCLNRLVQKGPRRGLNIINSKLYGSKGLITTEDIPGGGYICEYAGEILTRTQAIRRQKTNEQSSLMNYILFLNEHNIAKHTTVSNVLTTIIDPSKRGNIGRYLNHSCDPNCEMRSVRVDCPIPKICIFSKRFINAGEELCFHYNEGCTEIVKAKYPVKFKGTVCLCGSPNCSRYLPTANI